MAAPCSPTTSRAETRGSAGAAAPGPASSTRAGVSARGPGAPHAQAWNAIRAIGRRALRISRRRGTTDITIDIETSPAIDRAAMSGPAAGRIAPRRRGSERQSSSRRECGLCLLGMVFVQTMPRTCINICDRHLMMRDSVAEHPAARCGRSDQAAPITPVGR
ncbi:hypothetical protein MHIMP23_11410 [Methylobacterium hispanicum]